MTTLTQTGVRHACTVLSTPALIRLVTEIDDNGPIPPRGLTGTLANLPVPQLRQAVEQARALGLIHHRPGAGLCLTASGSDLADVYDAMARWARHHCVPAPVCNFTSRVRHTLSLLTVPLAVASQGVTEGSGSAPLAGAEADEDLATPRGLLHQWLHANPQLVQGVEDELAA
ncbi:hypothetical protein [Streptomyces colonosanans]|uniref:Uncharacterized protein n=1 Tax=Streptomyces colonosanans TaxID=1428652 RepID=A0A1S2PCZ8_9ACTN|nr:hypothetical protein [Streptomyces colonosanans]OIJ91651.1 hypothetical protein BIV24_15440 [Streptomyces colonosanans]